MMTAERMTVKQWEHHLLSPDAKLTLSELMALLLLSIRQDIEGANLGTQHLEGMVGTLDEFLDSTNETYRRLAARRSQPVPALAGGVNGQN